MGSVCRGQEQPLHRPHLTAIGAAHGKSVAQVVLRWLVQRDVVAIPKSVKRERMEQNFDIAPMDAGESLFFSHRDPTWVGNLGGVRVD